MATSDPYARMHDQIKAKPRRPPVRGRSPRLPSPALHVLTKRERETLALLYRGHSNRSMADQLYITENTVKFHLKNIYSKLGVGSRLQAIYAAQLRQLVRR